MRSLYLNAAVAISSAVFLASCRTPPGEGYWEGTLDFDNPEETCSLEMDLSASRYDISGTGTMVCGDEVSPLDVVGEYYREYGELFLTATLSTTGQKLTFEGSLHGDDMINGYCSLYQSDDQSRYCMFEMEL